MSEQFSGTVDIKTASGSRRVFSLDGDSGEIKLRSPSPPFIDDGEIDTILLQGASGCIHLGVSDAGYTIYLDGQSGSMRLGLPHDPKSVAPEKTTIRLDGASGNITLGGAGQEGDVVVQNKDGQDAIHLKGEDASLTVGGNGADGDVEVRNKDGKGTIQLDGDVGNIVLGGNGADGDVEVCNKDRNLTIHLDGDAGDIVLGGNGADGDVKVRNKNGNLTVHLDGDAGDIILHNADCAEDFDILESEQTEPGTVMVLNQEGKLQQSTAAYDKKVAGVVSGAGECKPGIVLDKQPGQANRRPVALVGKVYCKVDAGYSSIEVGDLLTTSPTPGHAMRVDDPFKAFGAVLGKALRPLQSGTGLIPILVALQ